MISSGTNNAFTVVDIFYCNKKGTKMMISSINKGILSLGLLLASSNVLAQLVPAEPVEIKSITYNGSGCPIGTVAENLAPDKQAFTLTFSDYIAEAGPDFVLSDGRKNCQLTLDLALPQGWQVSIASFDYRGFAFLDEGIMATYRTRYYFQGRPRSAPISRRAFGFFDDDFEFREEIDFESLVWSPCGAVRALNVNTSVSVRNLDKNTYPDAEGVIGTDSIDGQITQVWGISWRRCPTAD